MPLEHLVDTFNHRFSELGFENGALLFDGQTVFGQFGTLRFSSQFRPIRQRFPVWSIKGHEAQPSPFSVAQNASHSFETTSDWPQIISLDRLTRTVHMLNYLLLEPNETALFLEVHYQHVLGVKRDHGAFFEDIIRRCGLPLQRIVISLTLAPSLQNMSAILIDRLKNYRERGYGIAIRFDPRSDSSFIEHFRKHLLHRIAPDHLRFHGGLLLKAFPGREGLRRQQNLVKTIRGHDTLIHVTHLSSNAELENADYMGADWIEGRWLESISHHPRLAIGTESAERPMKSSRTG